MKRLRKNHPILTSILLLMVFLLIQGVAGLPAYFLPELQDLDQYLLQLIVEAVCLGALALLALGMGLGKTFRPSRIPFHQKLVPCLPMIGIYLAALIESIILLDRHEFRPPMAILWFLLCMLSVGMTEELLFRGIITRILYEKYGRTGVGVFVSVLLSSLLFGLMHLLNAATGEISLSAVLVQVAVAAAMGICLSAIYLRTRSYWTVALLHGFMDFCGLAASGLFGSGDMVQVIGGYSAENLTGIAIYLALGLFLLRPSKVRSLTQAGAETPSNHVLLLMGVLVLFSGLLTAVTVMWV